MKNDEKTENEEQTEESQFPSSSKLEELLKGRYDEEFTRKENLDDKANATMSIASTVATLYGGLGLAAATNLFSKFEINASVLVLLIGLTFLIVSIIISAKAYLIREYDYELKHDFFVENSNEGFHYKDEIDEYRNLESNDLSRIWIKSYGKCILKNYETNEKKADDLGWSQKIFLVGVASVPLFAALAVIPNLQ